MEVNEWINYYCQRQQCDFMINKTQNSLINSSQLLSSTLFPQRAQVQPQSQKQTLPIFNKKLSKSYHNSTCYTKPSHQTSQSHTINIQFNSSAKRIVPQEVIIRRRMMSTSEKFYNKKKSMFLSFVRQRQETIQELVGNCRQFLKIGTQQIGKIPVERTAMAGAPKNKNKAVVFKRKRKEERRISAKHENFIDQTGSVLVMEAKALTRMDQFFVNVPLTFRKFTEESNIESLLKHKTEPVAEERSLQSTEFQEYIPIKRRKMKKDPFVFGMSDKSFFSNPQRNNQKLLLYQDFLWKVNYSLGLCVKISQNQQNYKVYIGPGNNCNLIKSIIKRRYWWTISEKAQDCHFVWTQLKVNSIFKSSQQKDSNIDISRLYPFHLQEGGAGDEPDMHRKIFNATDLSNWREHMMKNSKFEQAINDKTYKHRINFYKCKNITILQKSSQLLIHNHLQSNFYIGNKKALFYFMRNYYQLKKENVFDSLPLTFHIVKGISDPNYKAFLKVYQQFQEKKKKGEDIKNVWIVKPGENSNRGNGISVCFGLDDLKSRINGWERSSDGSLRTFILQKYIEKPLLYKGRKFDIRHYILITCLNGVFKAYWYPEGYIRTSSSKFSLRKDNNPFIHLTNDAIQKNGDQYGRYEKGNKISYQTFQDYLTKMNMKPGESRQSRENRVFYQQILPKMKKLALDAVKSTYLYLDKQRKQHNFQLLGMDFMIDSDMRPYLIEINTNPCLQLSCPLLARIIPNLIEQTIKLCIDPLFPPPHQWQNGRKIYFSDNPLQQLNYQLFFDEAIDGKNVEQLFQDKKQIDKNMGKVQEDAETFQNDGNFESQD